MFEVIEAGLLSTFQDDGRPGLAHLGVPRSGAVDRGAMELANRLVGNAESGAVIETTMSAVRLRAKVDHIVAVTGAGAAVFVDGAAVAWGSPVRVGPGAELRVDAPYSGARCVIAVAGGFEPPTELGSRSSDLLTGLGPAPLRDGDVVPVGRASGEAHWIEVVPAPPLEMLPLVAGPHADWCDPAALDGARWTVGGKSNRIGVRLEGSRVARRSGEVPSFGVVLGSVQLPPSGGPVVLLADHAPTGGYPVVAVVAPEALDGLAQLRPGDSVVTRWVSR